MHVITSALPLHAVTVSRFSCKVYLPFSPSSPPCMQGNNTASVMLTRNKQDHRRALSKLAKSCIEFLAVVEVGIVCLGLRYTKHV